MKELARPNNWDQIKNGIFKGESGGDYNALFSFSNRQGGRYSGTRLTDMTVDQAIEFANPRGDYGQWVKGKIGRVATPMGAYQIVGSTLKGMKKTLGLSGQERMSEEFQDYLGLAIYHQQGTGAWEGYRGPSDTAPAPVEYFPSTNGDAQVQVSVAPNAGIEAPTPVNIVDQNRNAVQPYDNVWNAIGDGAKSFTITSQIDRWASEGVVDPEFRIDDKLGGEISSQFPDTYHDLLLSSSSQSVLASRMKWAHEDMERQDRFAAGGWRGTVGSLIGGTLDPVVVIPSLLTGGAAGAAIGAAGRGIVGRTLASSALGAVSNAGVEAASEYVTGDPHADPVTGAAVGAFFGALGGALMRTPAMAEANEALDLGAKFRLGKYAPFGAPIAATDEATTPIHLPGNVGAARSGLQRDSLIGEQNGINIEMSDESVPTGFSAGMKRLDVVGQMTTAKNPLTRTLGFHLFEETAGRTDHGVVPDSVNSRFTALHRQMMGNFNVEYVPAKNAYLKERGIHRLDLPGRARVEREFQEAVSDYIWTTSPSPDTNPHVVKAATAMRKGFADYAEQMREAGLWEGGPDANYLPLIADHNKIAAVDQKVNHEVMERMLKEAILEHTPGLSDDLAKRMAKGYWANLRKAGYGIEDGMSKSLHINDRDGFKQAFEEALDNKNLLSTDELNQVYDLLNGMVDDLKKTTEESSKGIARLKRRTLLDYNKRFTVQTVNPGETLELRVRDLFESDAELLFRRYARGMSGRIEFAKTKIRNPETGDLIMDGIKSEADLAKLKSFLAESYRLMPGARGDKEAELKNALDNLDFGWKRINGIPIYGQESAYAQWARRVKASQFIRLMSNMGLNQVQETWKIMSLTGFRASVSQMPAIRSMAKAVSAGQMSKDKLLNELSDMTGIGLDNLWNRYDLRLDDDRLGAMEGGKFTRFLDNALDVGQQLTTSVSLMRQITDYQQRWAMKAITQQIAAMGRKARNADGSFDLTKIKPRDRDRLASIGLGDDDAKLLFRNILDHGEFDGNKIVGMNTTAWDAGAVSKYRLFLGRYTDRLVQQNDFGALSKWMSRPVAGLLIQFRSFVFGAWAKSTLWTLNHGAFTDPRIIVLLLGEIAAGSATYAVRMGATSAATGEWDDYWDETMDPVNLLKNGWARTASASVLPMIADSALQFTAWGPQFGNARASGSPTDAWLGTPAVDHINSVKRFAVGAQKAVMEGEEMTRGQILSGLRALPLGNFIPITAALGALIKDWPER
ncbi:MAG: hypothetical protein QM744_12165 [Mesorhizobium sp.]